MVGTDGPVETTRENSDQRDPVSNEKKKKGSERKGEKEGSFLSSRRKGAQRKGKGKKKGRKTKAVVL